ncbi:hypothetical protein KR52_10020 [Synechococcus sp. KORDI-52]|nr:hypothetical protein KR52_10020 [Synechococcus sp. KORDI-52]
MQIPVVSISKFLTCFGHVIPEFADQLANNIAGIIHHQI